jgi:fatty acid desaturase
LKHWRDWQSIAYLIALPLLAIWNWQQSSINLLAYCIQLILVVGVCCISHNNAHNPIWQSRLMNKFTELWIGTLQGEPVFLFQPAHIASHHQHNQGPQDITGVTQHTKKNDILGYIMFPIWVLPALRSLRNSYLQNIWMSNRKKFWWVMAQHISIIVLWSVCIYIDFYKALIYAIVPQLIGLHFLLASNYLQHAHAEVSSQYNHSRNFVGFMNLFWFNVGYHTAHHENQHLHWAKLPLAHNIISNKISPELVETSLIAYFFKTLFLGTMFTKFKSRQL